MSTSNNTTTGPATHRHAVTPLDKQRSQLERLLKDPSKPAFIPPPPKEKTVRAAREMMKNVQGSSAGAGSGEFHVYKASRRREYERIKLMEEESQKEATTAEFEKKRKDAEDQADAKTAKNRARRQKKKERAKAKGNNEEGSAVKSSEADDKNESNVPIKKRRLVSGRELVFRKPGEESDGSEGEEEDKIVGPEPPTPVEEIPQHVEAARLTIHEDD
ncbi:hypothetical protein M378DRAFT_161106 [Amanita muscaria Koide BX008]|uniref:DUF1168-domain-containing protein n=1 Tax=Amanita muscaria (strain Koide BX008) TaxID=946122 RepID=A0A0C2WWQ5_AMAMK|nr:hypothetical protein M378DRAFT_161106 [Amanita muscaria Koide BX008]